MSETTELEFERQLDEIEAQIEAYEASNRAMRLRIRRLHAANDVARVMGAYQNAVCRHDDPRLPELSRAWRFFARREDDTLEMGDSGVLVGFEKIRRFYEELASIGKAEGCMYERQLASPQIVVAGDCQTARALWHCPGYETDPRLAADGGSEDGKPVAAWSWGYLQADFILEEGEWRIWHYHWYSELRADFFQGWVDYETPEALKGGIAGHPAYAGYDRSAAAPDRPTTWHNPYSRDSIQYPIPPSPEDFETWTDRMGPA